jgi:hypothetical protein
VSKRLSYNWGWIEPGPQRTEVFIHELEAVGLFFLPTLAGLVALLKHNGWKPEFPTNLTGMEPTQRQVRVLHPDLPHYAANDVLWLAMARVTEPGQHTYTRTICADPDVEVTITFHTTNVNAERILTSVISGDCKARHLWTRRRSEP